MMMRMMMMMMMTRMMMMMMMMIMMIVITEIINFLRSSSSLHVSNFVDEKKEVLYQFQILSIYNGTFFVILFLQQPIK